MADATVAKLNARFGPGGGAHAALEPDVVVQLQSIMRMHGLSDEELFYKWEVYCMKMDLGAAADALDMARLRAFKQDLQDALERRNQEQKQHHTPGLHLHKKGVAASAAAGGGAEPKRLAATPRNAAKGDVFGLLDLPGTPASSTHRKANGRLETPSASAVARLHPQGASSPADPLRRTPGANGTTPAAAAVPFNDRPNAGEVLEILNPDLPAATPPLAPYATARVKLTAASDQKKLTYKPLAMKLSEASEILDDRIHAFVDLVVEHHQIGYEAFGSAASQTAGAEVVAVGRIASDSAAGRLNAASLVLETSRRMGGGLRVPLDLTSLQDTSACFFFPGQIVALRGANPTGQAFVVRQVLDLPLLPNAASTPTALAAHRARMRGEGEQQQDESRMDLDGDAPPPPLNILFGAGPYTADDNLDFEPLHALCSVAIDSGADAVVLAGPFLDADHPLIATGDFDLPADADGVDPDTATLDTAFRFLVAPALQRLVAALPAVTVLLVPSVRDVLDKHVSWPQDTLFAAKQRRALGLPRAVRVVGNPMTLAINEAVLGISAQDVLYELRQEELAVVAGGAAGTPGSAKALLAAAPAAALPRACRYLVEQRHFFPLFPPVDRRRLPRTGVPALGDESEDDDDAGLATGAMLDVSYLKLGEMGNVRPDVLVVPSALPPFAKVVESVLVINPGFLSKRRGAGTYAHMALHAPPAADVAVDATDANSATRMVGHRVFQRARVEITRI